MEVDAEGLNENWALLHYYVSSGNFLTTFWGKLIGSKSKGINS
jgi:hypothetical protein